MRLAARYGFTGRGSAWSIAQFLLYLIILVGAPIEARRRSRSSMPGLRPVRLGAALLAILAAAAVFVRSWRDLGESVTATPEPRPEGQLVAQGIYRVVRHPMYGGILLAVLGYALAWGSWFALAGLGLLGGFFARKAAEEERLLLARYPEYEGYRQRVRHRFIPGVL